MPGMIDTNRTQASPERGRSDALEVVGEDPAVRHARQPAGRVHHQTTIGEHDEVAKARCAPLDSGRA